MSTKPARNGARWTKQEEDEILASIKTGLSIRTIADRKERTTGGIRSRLTQIACRFVEVDKMSLYEAAGRTGIKAAKLQEALKLKPTVRKDEGPSEKAVASLKALEEFLDGKKRQIERNSYSKSVPLAAYYDREKVAFLEPILLMLKDIQERLEKR